MRKMQRKGRISALIVCYQIDIRGILEEEVVLNLLRDMHFDKEIYSFVKMYVLGVLQNKNRIDELISKYSINWDISRMSYIDRNILRIAIYEMLYLPNISPITAINEAIEIAKIYSSSESGKFINGILDRIRKELLCEKNIELPTNNK